MKTVLYFQSKSKINAREKFGGVRKIAVKCDWHVQVVEGLPSRKRLGALMEFWHPVGAIIECGGTAVTVDPAIFGTLPVVFLDHDPSSLPKNAFCVTHDSAATARMAAQELLRGEAKEFAFVPYPEHRFWSEERERSFVSALALNGYGCHTFHNQHAQSDSTRYQGALRAFIADLPKPCALFAANDQTAAEVLDPPNFLHFTRTERAADEDSDVLLHLDFEPPTGLTMTQGFFNDAAIGPAVHHWGAKTIPQTIAAVTPFPTVYSSLLDETGRISAYCMTNATGYNANGDLIKRYVAWQPPEDVFSNSSFTVECCYKTAGQLGNYIPLVRRLGGYNCQFNLGFNGGSNVGKLAALTVPGATGNTVQIIDTVRTDDGQWHHAAVVFNRALGTMTLFRDYEPISSLEYTGIVAPTDSPIYIGGAYANDGTFKPYDGAIDNVRVTMRALTVGEFLRSDHVVPSGKTMAWASFDNTLDAIAPAYALANGIASAAATGGSVPSYRSFSRGDDIRIEDGLENVLRRGNLASLSCATGVVKYADNLLLPLVKDQTIEFRVKAGPQEKFAGVVRCNLYRDTAPIPVWGLSAGELDSRVLRIRCSIAGASYFETGMNEDTGVVAFDGKWHHIALTLSQANGKVTASIYKDYEATPSWTKTKAGQLCYGAGYASVWIGASSSTTAFFHGQIDELRISRGILTPDEFLRHGKRGVIISVR